METGQSPPLARNNVMREVETGLPYLRKLGDWKIFPQASVENQSPVSLPRRYAPRKGRLATDFRPRPSGDFPVSDFPEVRISTVLAAGTGYLNGNTKKDAE